MELARWISNLGSDTFAAREKASADLARTGDLARPALREDLKNRLELEVRRRIEKILEGVKPGQATSAEELRHLRAVEVLEDLGTAKARRLLEKLARGVSGAPLTRDAPGALRRLSAAER